MPVEKHLAMPNVQTRNPVAALRRHVSQSNLMIILNAACLTLCLIYLNALLAATCAVTGLLHPPHL